MIGAVTRTIRKSGSRFSDKIMRQSHHAPEPKRISK
jgi:hypothetical protein